MKNTQEVFFKMEWQLQEFEEMRQLLEHNICKGISGYLICNQKCLERWKQGDVTDQLRHLSFGNTTIPTEVRTYKGKLFHEEEGHMKEVSQQALIEQWKVSKVVQESQNGYLNLKDNILREPAEGQQIITFVQ